MWSAVNVLRNSPKISDMIKREIFQLKLFKSNGKFGVQISAVFETREHVDLRRLFWNNSFLTFKASTFFGVLSFFFSKCRNFHEDLKNEIKISEKNFGF